MIAKPDLKPDLGNVDLRNMINFVLVAALLLLSSCAFFTPPDRFEAQEASFLELSGWPFDNHSEALQSFRNSCPLLALKPRPETTGSDIKISASIWTNLCSEADKAASTQTARAFFEKHFTPYRISNRGNEQGLFTGYYEPLLYGSLKRHGNYRYPVYAVPADFKKPYYSRKEIDEGALAGKNLEIVWTDDPVMLFFMHIQGSGRIRLPDGKEFIAAYAEQNGHSYVTLGKLMGEQGLIAKDRVNFFTIRQWLYDNPQEAISMMQNNPSYVFFRKQDKLEVVGSIAAPLTPKRSLAVDNRYIPYGLPLYLETSLPQLPGAPSKPFNRLMIAQDTGGAIKKPVRGDVFFGHGQEAEYLAGFMKQRGRYFLLIPKALAYNETSEILNSILP